MSLAIAELIERSQAPDAAALDAFVREHGSPIVEGTSITFLYRGEAEGVGLRHFLSGFPRTQPFRPIEGTDLWFLTIEIPPRSRLEYKLEVQRGGRGRLVRDPLNPAFARDPFGSNSVCLADGYETPEWTQDDPEAREGTIETVTFPSSVHGGEAEVDVYLPARMRSSRRYPLLITFDGLDFVHYAALRTVLDNLIHRYEIPPMIVALSQSPDRFTDYTCSDAHARFVIEDMVPALEAELPLRMRPRDRGLMGASLGAVAAFWIAHRYPGRFANLLLQSGSFRFHDTGYEEFHPALEPVVRFVEGYREDPQRVAEKVHLSCGRYESLIYENRALAPLLHRAGMQVRLEEARDGHCWDNWRDRLRDALTWLFPGPLGLVYE